MVGRHPVCPHTLQAVRSRKAAFRLSVRAIFGNRLKNSELRKLADAAEMAFTEIDPEDMPERAEAPQIVGLDGSNVVRE